MCETDKVYQVRRNACDERTIQQSVYSRKLVSWLNGKHEELFSFAYFPCLFLFLSLSLSVAVSLFNWPTPTKIPVTFFWKKTAQFFQHNISLSTSPCRSADRSFFPAHFILYLGDLFSVHSFTLLLFYGFSSSYKTLSIGFHFLHRSHYLLRCLPLRAK